MKKETSITGLELKTSGKKEWKNMSIIPTGLNQCTEIAEIGA
jgi:hypothetical protein